MSLKVCIFAMICIVACAIIKTVRPDFLPYVRIGATVIVSAFALSVIAPVVTYINSLLAGSGLGEWGGVVLKALGTALLVQICADICRDCGESSAAASVELIGKLEILILCLPMIKKIIETAFEVLRW